MKYPSYLEAYIHSISPEQKRGKGIGWGISLVVTLLGMAGVVAEVLW